jgi:hypothetical protein
MLTLTRLTIAIDEEFITADVRGKKNGGFLDKICIKMIYSVIMDIEIYYNGYKLNFILRSSITMDVRSVAMVRR